MEQRRGAVGTAVQYVQDDGWAARSLLVREGRGRACQQGHHGWTGRGPMGASAQCASATQPSTAGERGGPARLGMNLGSAGEAEGEARAGGWNGTGVGKIYATIHSRGSSWDDGWDARINFIGVRAHSERAHAERAHAVVAAALAASSSYLSSARDAMAVGRHACGGRARGRRTRDRVYTRVPCEFPPSRDAAGSPPRLSISSVASAFPTKPAPLSPPAARAPPTAPPAPCPPVTTLTPGGARPTTVARRVARRRPHRRCRRCCHPPGVAAAAAGAGWRDRRLPPGGRPFQAAKQF